MELTGKRVVVVGLAKSGLAAARLCLSRGAHVVGTDQKPLDALPLEARELGLELSVGGHDRAGLATADLIVTSPGVPDFPALREAVAIGVPVIGELELASRFVSAPIAAVGGTNGKSTVTTLVAGMLADRKLFVGANLGRPAAEAAEGAFEVVVWEVSSFQLERAPTFKPKVSVLLNVSEDHLDRYESFQHYAQTKGNAFANQAASDVAVVPVDDEVCRAQASRGHGRVVTFGAGADYAVGEGVVTETASGTVFDLAGSGLYGRHNWNNAAAAIATARALGADADRIRSALNAFEPLPHRMAQVAVIDSVAFYDDSKATNVGAAVTALLGLAEERGVLIAGGRDKHGSYAPLVDALQQKGRAVVVLGEAAERIAQAVGDRVPVARATDMQEAVTLARSLARAGDAVLLSPACSSFDQFQSYAERGEVFAAIVAALAGGKEIRA